MVVGVAHGRFGTTVEIAREGRFLVEVRGDKVDFDIRVAFVCLSVGYVEVIGDLSDVGRNPNVVEFGVPGLVEDGGGDNRVDRQVANSLTAEERILVRVG
jgi:hypothetical protein